MLITGEMQKCGATCIDSITMSSEISNKIVVDILTLFAGIVPYAYLPIIGFLGSLLRDIPMFVWVINEHGYFLGGIFGIIPLILNIVAISSLTATGMYLCKTVTYRYKLSNMSHMNLLNFRIKFYEMTNNKQKLGKLTSKKNKKVEAMKNKCEKINYLQLINITAFCILLQEIAVIIQKILI